LLLDARSIAFCGRFFFGENALNQAADFCREIQVKERNAVLINDENTWRIAGERFSQSLSKSGFERIETTIVEKGAVRSEVEKAREKIRSLRPCVVFGIGGGVNIDIAKASAFLEMTPWITVPTIFAADAMAGIKATFRAERIGVDGKAHEGDYDLTVGPPLACVVDTNVIKQAPWRFQAAGFADYISKICAVEDWNLAYSRQKTAVFSEYAIMLAKAQTRYLMENAARIRRKEEPAFTTFLQAMINDGFLTQMGEDSRILFGSEHVVAQGLMEEQIQAGVSGLHGEQVAIGTILMTYLQGQDWRSVKKALQEVGAPVAAEQIGLVDEAVVRALTRGREINETWLRDRPDFYTILMEKPLTRETAKEIAIETGTIRS
jgi:glycerol-1-phosphate dehydrogenase [NAD(P)+]